MRNIISKILLILGITGLIVSSVMIVDLFKKQNSTDPVSPSEIITETEVIKTEITENKVETAEYSEKSLDMEIITINNKDYIGVIEIPWIEIELNVQSECTEDNLEVSPCRFNGDINENNLIIAGHNYRKHFSKIKWLPLNSKVYFKTVDGTKYEYEVTFIEEINEHEVDKIYNGDWDLTLFTCSTDNSKRTVVRCKIIKDGGSTNEG